MRTVTRPVGIVLGGAGFSVIETPDEGARDVLRRVIQSVDFALCAEPEQRMLLAVAALADECGIASGWDETTGTAHGVSIAKLAMKAGMSLPQASDALDGLCRDEYLYRLQPTSPSRGLVWVLPDYEDDEGGIA